MLTSVALAQDPYEVIYLVDDFIGNTAVAVTDITEDEIAALLLTVPMVQRMDVVNELILRGVPENVVWLGYLASEGLPVDTPPPEPTPPGVPRVPPPRPVKKWPWILGALALGVVGFAAGSRYGKSVG